MLYLDCSCLNLSLGISWNFCDFLGIFRASKHFLGISWICFCTEKYFEKKRKSTLPDWAEPEARPNPLRPHRPNTPARRGPSGQRPWPGHRPARPLLPVAPCARPIKGEAAPPCTCAMSGLRLKIMSICT
jgi:hypothetical protein